MQRNACYLVLCLYCIISLVVSQPSVLAGIEEFQCFDVRVWVLDEFNRPVHGASVKAYSKDWPTSHPYDGFVQTAADGTCYLRLPRGRWIIVAGGGAPFCSANSGRALFLASDMSIEEDTSLELRPEQSRSFFITFYDRADIPANVDQIYAAPSVLVPNCLMPDIGRTYNGECFVNTNASQEIALFLVRRPTSNHEGYFIFCDHTAASEDQEIRSSELKLNHIHFDGRAPDNSPGRIEWDLCFPYQDIERHYLHQYFEIDGSADAFLTPDFVNYYFWVHYRDEDNWHYCFAYRGLDFSSTSETTLTAGGPLTYRVSILNLVDSNRTQFLLGPVEDAYGNVLRWCFPGTYELKIPITIRLNQDGRILYFWELNASKTDNFAFQVDRTFPPSSVFHIEWDIGPYAGSHIIEGLVHDSQYQYTFETVHTDHFDIHAPEGYHEKAIALGKHWEAAHSIFCDWIGGETPDTSERNFFIQPTGTWASYRGQELYLHGFQFWHPRDPASRQWEGVALHEIGHRIESEHFRIDGKSLNLGGWKNEAVASLLGHLAIAGLHGDEFAWRHRRIEARSFFDQLENPDASSKKEEDLRFFVQTYLPRKYGPRIIRGFFREWNEAWSDLQSRGFSQDEAFAAIFSTLAGENLWWIFELCGFQGSQESIASAMDLIMRWDVNDDREVDILDLVLVARHFGESDSKMDVNRDGKVDILDLLCVGQHFGRLY